MSEVSDESFEDPWAWLHTIDREAPANYSSFHVVAAVLPEQGEPFTERCREAVEEQDVLVDEVRDSLPGDADGDWFWVLPDDAEPAPGRARAPSGRSRPASAAHPIRPAVPEPANARAGHAATATYVQSPSASPAS